jgi:hypothetical protein
MSTTQEFVGEAFQKLQEIREEMPLLGDCSFEMFCYWVSMYPKQNIDEDHLKIFILVQKQINDLVCLYYREKVSFPAAFCALEFMLAVFCDAVGITPPPTEDEESQSAP